MMIEVLFGYNFFTKDINTNKKIFKKDIELKIVYLFLSLLCNYTSSLWAY